jgi:hypothetical protein
MINKAENVLRKLGKISTDAQDFLPLQNLQKDLKSSLESTRAVVERERQKHFGNIDKDQRIFRDEKFPVCVFFLFFFYFFFIFYFYFIFIIYFF